MGARDLHGVLDRPDPVLNSTVLCARPTSALETCRQVDGTADTSPPENTCGSTGWPDRGSLRPRAVAVADVQHADAADEVQILLARFIPDTRTGRARS
jgi:hypothetical protein